HLQISGHRGMMKSGGPLHFVEVEVQLRHQPYRVILAGFGGALEQLDPIRAELLDQGRILRQQRERGVGVRAAASGSKGVRLVKYRSTSAVGQKVLRDFSIAVEYRQLAGRAVQTRIPEIDVDSVCDQQAETLHLIVFGRPADLLLEHFRGSSELA